MLGAITGDIVGSRFEWENIKHMDFELFHPACRYTDDSVQTIAVAEALLTDSAFATILKRYYARYPDAGYGKRFAAWAESADDQPYDSYGNGSAMRVSPVAWFYPELDGVLTAAEESASVTHSHPEGIRGARCIAGAIFLARKQASRNDIRAWVERCGYDLRRSCAQLRPTFTFDVTCQGTVGPAVTAFLESDSFESSIRLAVSLGGDSDTLACITGSIAEAFYGGVPTHIAARARSYLDSDLQRVMRDFFAACRRPAPATSLNTKRPG